MMLKDPIISITHMIQNSDQDLLYLKCLNWMKSKNIIITEKKRPDYIIGFHEDKIGPNRYETILDHPKNIEVILNPINEEIRLTINIDPTNKSPIDSYTKRKLFWMKIVGDILSHCGVDEKNIPPDSIRASKLYRKKVRINFIFPVITFLGIIVYTYKMEIVSTQFTAVSIICYLLVSLSLLKKYIKKIY